MSRRGGSRMLHRDLTRTFIMPPTGRQLLKAALPLIPQYGFSRIALARSVQQLGESEQLSDTAVSALFGDGERARKTLVNAWLDEGLVSMAESGGKSVGDALHARLAYNESVLAHLPEAFALLSVPNAKWTVVPPLDPLPALQHSARIADEACHISGDASTRLSWYARRAWLMGVYSAAELHQLTSPSSAHAFLDDLLRGSSALEATASSISQFSEYVFRSWAGIARSRGLL
ncbi:Ubiquinone biosynthesis protein [Mycena kentingensis (nom. inval.)]|nr:Ubiquinone biosynthesis protein [Mycena kentingensis (nom. inval.)]